MNRPSRTPSPQPRLWPAVIILVLQAASIVVSITPEVQNLVRFGYMMLGPAIAVLLFAVWLLFASRLAWRERFAILLGNVAMAAIAGTLAHDTMRTALWIYGAPLAMLATTSLLFVLRQRPPRIRMTAVLAAAACGWIAFTAGKLDGFDGSYLPEFSWRWSQTHEQSIGEGEAKTVSLTPDAPLELAPGDWPGFRGPQGSSRVTVGTVPSDWATSTPREAWRVKIGPGWSSFAHVAGHLFSQEQRGNEEAVVCYDAASGREIWRDTYPSRFSEVVSGAGPRATPTWWDGVLFTMGARATLSAYNATTGEVIWRRDLMAELDARLPMWGFSSSPVITRSKVIVYADGRDGHGWVAYDARTGTPQWHVDARGNNYTSAQLASIDGEELVLLIDGRGIAAVDPATGTLLWHHTPTGLQGLAMVQPQQIGPNRIVVPLGDGIGVALLEVRAGEEGWTVEEKWTSRFLKPSFNDFVYHEGFLYGFDQSIFTCVDAETGQRKWKRGRYGFGQVLLVEESATLVIASESGEIVLLAADPTTHRELGRVPALTGKTWNHPIIAGDRLFLRNGKEALAFEIGIPPQQ